MLARPTGDRSWIGWLLIVLAVAAILTPWGRVIEFVGAGDAPTPTQHAPAQATAPPDH